jgi:hypothetical protein
LPGWRRAPPITRDCAHLGLARSSDYERLIGEAKADKPVIEVLNQVAAKNRRWGFGMCLIGCAILGIHGITSENGVFIRIQV